MTTPRTRAPKSVLAHYAAIASRATPDALPAAVLRAGSVAGRDLIAHAATQGNADLDGIVDLVLEDGHLSSIPHVSPEALADLARVFALQNLFSDDRPHAYALYNKLLSEFGATVFTPVNQGLHAQLALDLGDYENVGRLLGVHRKIHHGVRVALEVDMQNPFCVVPDSEQARLRWLRALQTLIAAPAPGLRDDDSMTPFDRLTCEVEPAPPGPLVSVIVSVFKPPPTLRTSVQSLCQQSWQDLEIIIVDDASPEGFDGIFRECLGYDARVRLVRLAKNGGAYAARNAGIEASTGKYIAFHDADDWCHPHRIRDQVQPLLEHPGAVATHTNGLRVSDRLLLNSPGRPYMPLCSSSLVVRGSVLRGQTGFFDRVRKGADSEYTARLESVFGKASVLRIDGAAYTLIQTISDSLSRGDFKGGWRHPVRTVYRSSYENWHEKIRDNGASSYVEKAPGKRPFFAPINIHSEPLKKGERVTLDILYVGDWTKTGRLRQIMLQELKRSTAAGLACGAMHVEPFERLKPGQPLLWTELQAFANRGSTSIVTPDLPLDVRLVIVRAPEVFQFPPEIVSNIRAEKVAFIADRLPMDAQGEYSHYFPPSCSEVSRDMFGCHPLWVWNGEEPQEEFMRTLSSQHVSPVSLPIEIQQEEWLTERRRFRSDLPVVGTVPLDQLVSSSTQVIDILPSDPRRFDVRLIADSPQAEKIIRRDKFDGTWMLYRPEEVDLRNYLGQLDFFVYFPDTNDRIRTHRLVLAAAASGCIVLLPESHKPTYGDIAVYLEAEKVGEAIRAMYKDRATCDTQRARAKAALSARFGSPEHVRWVRSLIAENGGDTNFEGATR